MSRQIQWNDGRVTELDLLSNTQSTWTALGPRTWSVLVQGERFKVECEKGPDEKGHLVVRINGVRSTVRVMDERTQLLEKMGMSVVAGAGSADIHAPMPGKVLQVLVAAGDEVEADAPLLVLEAMKMENVIKAVSSGKVSEVPASVGKAVEKGALLVGFESD